MAEPAGVCFNPLMLPPVPQLLADLVRRPSVNPMGRTDLSPDIALEDRVTDYLEGRLEALGVPYRRQTVAPGRDNLVAEYRPPGPPPFTVLFECHQDTVPVDGMSDRPVRGEGRRRPAVRPRGVRREGRRRRRCSPRSPGWCGRSPPGSAAVTLAFTVDEEHAFLGVQHLMKSGVRADYAVVAEPTGLNIVNAHKGVARWQLETAGRACHSSRPEQG